MVFEVPFADYPLYTDGEWQSGLTEGVAVIEYDDDDWWIVDIKFHCYRGTATDLLTCNNPQLATSIKVWLMGSVSFQDRATEKWHESLEGEREVALERRWEEARAS